MICESCVGHFTEAQEMTLPPAVADDGRVGRFCPECRCDLIEEWPSDEPAWADSELQQVAEWRAEHATS